MHHMHASYEKMQAIGVVFFWDHGWGSMITWKTADSRLKDSKHKYNSQEPRRYCCSTKRLIHVLQMQETCRTPFVTHSIVRCKKTIYI